MSNEEIEKELEILDAICWCGTPMLIARKMCFASHRCHLRTYFCSTFLVIGGKIIEMKKHFRL